MDVQGLVRIIRRLALTAPISNILPASGTLANFLCSTDVCRRGAWKARTIIHRLVPAQRSHREFPKVMPIIGVSVGLAGALSVAPPLRR